MASAYFVLDNKGFLANREWPQAVLFLLNLGAPSSDVASGAELNKEAPSALPDFRRVAWLGEGDAGTELIK